MMSIADIHRRLDDLESSLAHVIRVGVVASTDPAAGMVRVRFEDADGLVTYPFPVLQRKTLRDQDYHMPDVGEHVACVCLGYGLEQGVCLGAIYSKADTPPVADQDKRHVRFEDGTWFQYDRRAHRLSGEIASGEVVLRVGKGVHLTLEGGATVRLGGDAALAFGGRLDVVIEGQVDVDLREKIRIRRFKELESWTEAPVIAHPYEPLEGLEAPLTPEE